MEAAELRQKERIVNVILLAKSKIGIIPPMKVVMKPARACFLGTETKQKGARSSHLASVDGKGGHAFHQVINGLDLGEERFELVEG